MGGDVVVSGDRKTLANKNFGGRLAYLDGLRGIAALGVALFSHYGHFAKGPNSDFSMVQAPGYWVLAPLYGYTWTAVELFFAISGVVFAHVYTDRLPSAIEFAKKRFARLYPLHLTTLVAVTILVMAYQQNFGRAPVYENNNLSYFILNLLFIHFGVISEDFSFNGPSYSLAIEAVMYAVFYMILRYLNLAATSWILCIGGMVFLALPHSFHHLPLINNSIALGLVGFFGGVILNNGGGKATLLPLAAIALIPFSINLFCKVYAVIFVVMLFISWSAILQKFLSMRILTWLGDRSLSIYLVHFPVQIGIMLTLGSKVPFTSYWLLFSYGLILIGVAHLTHNLIEMPAQAWINSLGNKSPHDSQLRATPR